MAEQGMSDAPLATPPSLACSASCLETLLPPSIFTGAVLLCAIYGVCFRPKSCAASSALATLYLLALGLGCGASALLLEPGLHTSTVTVASFQWYAIAAAGGWVAAWALFACFEAGRRGGLRLALYAVAVGARATPLVVGSLSAPARAALLPWLPVEAALLCLTIAPALATLRAAARDRRRAKLGLLLGEGAAVEPLNASQLPASAAAAGADEKEMARAKAEQERQWFAEQKGYERLFPDDDVRGCFGWLRAFHRTHSELLEKAKKIHNDRRVKKVGDDLRRRGAVNESLAALRKHVWTVAPRAPLAAGTVCSLLLTATSFLVPWAQGKLFDAAIDAAVAHRIQQRTETLDEAFAALLPWLGAVGGFYAASWVFEVAVGILFALFAHTAVTRLRSRMFLNLIQQDIGFYDDHNSGELSSRLINDSGQLNAFAQFTSQALLKALVQLCGSLPAMFASHWQLALLATVISPLNWLIVRRAGVVQGMYGIVQQETMARANGAAVEALGAMRTVQANTGELGEWRRFALRICHFLRVVLVTVHTQTMVIFSQMGLAKVRDVAVLALGMRMVLQNAMDPTQGLTIGGFVAFNMYVSLYEQGFSALANMYMSLAETLISIGRFLQLLEREPAIAFGVGDAPPTCRGAVELRDVCFHYPHAPDAPVLKGISFVATPGTVVALVGESGAGKSTVGRLLERFYDPQGGALLLDGVDFRKLELRWLRRQIGLVEQEPVRGCDARLEHKGWVARLGLSHSSPRFPLYRCSST
jgi:ATP-binding cassette subfamily B protein